MAIPKVIYQTYSSKDEIPWMARFHIWNMCRMNPGYEYRFFDDNAIKNFIKEEFNADVFEQYSKITIGAAKADFFRYAILLKKGGIYLDIDSRITGRLDDWLLPNDNAIITQESNPGYYVQWALIYEKGHPFLKKILEKVLDNIRSNRFPNNVHKMTGPTVYSNTLQECFKDSTYAGYRILGHDFEGHIKFKYWLSGFSFGKKEPLM